MFWLFKYLILVLFKFAVVWLELMSKNTFQKKVDPSLKVDVKGNIRGPNGRWGRGVDDRPRATGNQEMVWKQRQQEQMRWEQQLRHREDELRRWEHDEYMRRASEDR